ncbi:MAG TPA: MYXO-CTERM sorting domain-containing protein [Polyangiaceae bacterium]
MSTRPTVFSRRFSIIALALSAFLLSSLALAAGRVEWKSKNFKERDDKAWRLELAIYLPRAPDVPHVPMKFEFQPEVYYERDMMDGDKIVERKVPLDNRQPIIESVDVGFLDSGSGKIESRTRFSFKLTRAHGYEAGEYKVTITDARNDSKVGVPTTLVFDGENEVIDRRAMVFNNGDKKPKKDSDVKKVGDDKGGDDKKADDKKSDDDSKAKSDDKPASDDSSNKAAAPNQDTSAAEDAETIKKKPGGCGCRLEDSATSSNAALALGALGLGITLLNRRRKRAA